MTVLKEAASASLCLALAQELRVAREMLETLAGVLVADTRFVEDHLDQLQSFDRVSQYIEEGAAVLDRIGHGQTASEALHSVRLDEMQQRLSLALG